MNEDLQSESIPCLVSRIENKKRSMRIQRRICWTAILITISCQTVVTFLTMQLDSSDLQQIMQTCLGQGLMGYGSVCLLWRSSTRIFIFSMLSLVSGFTMVAFYVLRLYKNWINTEPKNDPGHGYVPTQSSSDLLKLQFLESAFQLSLTIGCFHILASGLFHFQNRVVEQCLYLEAIRMQKIQEKAKYGNLLDHISEESDIVVCNADSIDYDQNLCRHNYIVKTKDDIILKETSDDNYSLLFKNHYKTTQAGNSQEPFDQQEYFQNSPRNQAIRHQSQKESKVSGNSTFSPGRSKKHSLRKQTFEKCSLTISQIDNKASLINDWFTDPNANEINLLTKNNISI